MSVKLMSAIFETEFRDLQYTKDGESRTAKASTCKLLLLAIADHANDYGESAYPGYSKLEIKTALSRQGIADTLDALKYNGVLSVAESPSRLNTNNYTINQAAFPALARELPEVIESSHLTTTSQATLLPPVKPLDLKHTLTINQPSLAQAPDKPSPLPLDWQIAQGAETITMPTAEQEFRAKVDLACMAIARFGADLEPLARAFILTRRALPIGKTTPKAWAAAFREMKTAGATADMVTLVTQELCEKFPNISDPFGIKKTVIARATPMTPGQNEPSVVAGVLYV